MDYKKLYNEKLTDLSGCLDAISSGDRICFGGDCNQPFEIMENLHNIAGRVTGIECIKARMGDYKFVTQPGMNGHINSGGFFFSSAFYEGMKHGNSSYIPLDLCDYGSIVTSYKPCDTFIAAVSPMDENGNFNLGLCLMWEEDCLPTCNKIILEVNPKLPRVRGGLEINIKDVTLLMETHRDLMVIPDAPITEIEDTIGGHVAELINDGDCLQLGIGALPNAVANHLMDKKDLGLHTEMFTSAMGRMIRAGVITGARKNINKGLHIGTFAGGDEELYKTLGENPNCRIMKADYAVNPMIIMQNDNQVSINTVVEMDLTGQVCSESIGSRQISGSGGAFDFAYGAMHSKGGKGILAFQSITKKGQSKIQPVLSLGAQVTIPRNYVDYVVTEYGVARLKGRSIKERAEQLIAIAHPDQREYLRQEARKLFYI